MMQDNPLSYPPQAPHWPRPRSEKSIHSTFQKVHDIFAKDDFDLGCDKDVIHNIDPGNHALIFLQSLSGPYCRFFFNTRELKSTHQRMIVPPKRPWPSRPYSAKEERLQPRCNQKLTEVEQYHCQGSYPLSRIDDSLDLLGGAKFLSAMYFISRYWQTEIHLVNKRSLQ